AHVSDDVLDLDDRVVDQHAGDEAQREQRHFVQGKPEQVHEPERRDRRQRDRQRRDQRRAPVAQEQEHDDDREDRTFDERGDRALVLPFGIFDAGIELREADPRVVGFDLLHFLDRSVVHGDVRGAFGPLDAEGDHLPVVDLGDRGLLGEAVIDARDLVEPDRPPPADADPRVGELARAVGVAEDADGLTRTGDLRDAARGVDVDLPERLVERTRGDTQRLHLCRIEDDANLAIDPARPADGGHAGDRQQATRDGVVDEPAELLHRHVVGLHRKEADRPARDFFLGDPRLEDSVGEIAADLVDRVLDGVDGLVRVRPDLELDEGVAAAFASGRLDFVHPVDRANGRFDLLRYLGFDLGGRRARLADRYVDCRKIDVRTVVDVHLVERNQPGQRQADEQDYRDDRVTDRPRGNVPKVHWPEA